jgi:predicted O-linked N-acetylglucosamine transferase (SPINDLY family)
MANLTIQETLDQAVRYHQAGQLAPAERFYRQVLQLDARNADALHLLGVLAYQNGGHGQAIELIRRAIDIQPAIAGYYCNLGNALRAAGQLDQALAAQRKALELNPQLAEAHNNFALLLHDRGQYDQAIAECRKAIAINPNYVDAHTNLGNALMARREFLQAGVCYRTALALNPKFAPAHNNLGNALAANGEVDAAVACYRTALRLAPAYAEAYFNLGDALTAMRQPQEAIAAFRRAIVLKPNYPEAYNNLANLCRALKHAEHAIAAYQKAIELNPAYFQAHSNLGMAWRDAGKVDEAISAFRSAIALAPDFPDAHSNLGMALLDDGQVEAAIACFRKVIALNPTDHKNHSHLLLALNYHVDSTPQLFFGEARAWAAQHAAPLKQFMRAHSNHRAPDRPLHIGYVSADFRQHPCALFLAPLLSAHNHTQVDITCYSEVTRPDEVTNYFRKLGHVWRDTAEMTDEQLDTCIREDCIDILVDLKLHTDQNRLLVFARKPAPIQVTWLGYPGTTGLTTIDYRMTDPYLDPPLHADISDALYSERSIRLPDCFWCYDPMIAETPDLAPNSLPALERKAITFGCLNNLCKVNDLTLNLWARVLQVVPDSRLLLLCDSAAHQQRCINIFQAAGIDPRQIAFVGRRPRAKYLQLYHQIDIALDPMPCPGHTTTFDSLWMGVPVVTLPGNAPIFRAGRSILSNIGLPEFIAESPESYVTVAATQAADTERLAMLRATLRARMRQSPLMDGPRFARNMESAFRAIWQKWCEST